MMDASYFNHDHPGCLHITGEHRVDFLQRQTTNDITTLSQDRVLLAVLTNPTARILDLFTLYLENQEGQGSAITALTLPGRGASTAAYLKSRIFFMDRVKVEDDSPGTAQISLTGPQAGEVLRSLGVSPLPLPGEVVQGELNGANLHGIGPIQGSSPGYRLVFSTSYLASITSALEASGASKLDSDEYEVLRVEAGLPGENELTEEHTPLEVGLESAISDHKGCYTGQEVIARQLTYDKVTRHLVGLKLEADAAVGAQVLAEDKRAGSITSIAHSPRFGPIALAVLRRPYHEPGTQAVVEGAGQRIKATVVELPFH